MKEVAVGILVRGGRVLACQRRRNAPYPLKWEFPGGKLEKGENAARALARELKEELSITASVGKEFFRQEWIYPEGAAVPERDGAFRVFYHIVTSFSGEPANNAFEQIRWVLPSDLLEMDILEGNRKTVELLAGHTQEDPPPVAP